MDKVLKIGIIGCGAIGKDHCRRIIETVPGATVVAVSDYVAAAADETAAKYGIKSYGNDCDGMIKDPEVEAVVITSIDPTHHDYVMKTLAEEKWCFCEKPLSQNAKDCEEIIRREQEIGKRLVQVGFMRHYDRGYAEMKRIIASGELGKPLIIKACHRNVSQGPGFKTENGVTNVAIHELDICRWLLDDEYEDVQCVKVRQSSNSDKGYDNPQVMLMRTKKGCFIDVEVQVADGYGYDIQCEVVCENGTVKLPDPYAVVCRSRPAGWDSVKPAESMPIMTDWKERFIEAYDIEFCKWVESVHAGKLTGPSSWDGYVACVAGDALNASRGTSQFLKVETMEKPEMYKYSAKSSAKRPPSRAAILRGSPGKREGSRVENEERCCLDRSCLFVSLISTPHVLLCWRTCFFLFPIVHKISLVFAVGRLYHKNRTKKIRRPSAAGKERYEHTKENPDSLRRPADGGSGAGPNRPGGGG